MTTATAIQTGVTMRALVQDGYGSADVLRVREIARPTITADRVLVRVRAASLNALDWHSVHPGVAIRIATALMRQPDEPVRGVDLAGVVEEVGANVTALHVGDEVFGGGLGSLAEFALARERGLALKPQDMPFEEAATIGVAGRTALQAVRDHAQVRPGQRVLVNGAGGGVGTFTTQIAKAFGAHVTAVTGPGNVDLIRELGADEVLDYTKDDLTRAHQPYDAVIDVAANRSIGDLRSVLTPRGVLVMVGADKRGGLAIFTRLVDGLARARLLRQRVIFFVARPSREDLAVLAELIGSAKVRAAIDRTYALDEAVEAMRYLGTGRARAKVVVTI